MARKDWMDEALGVMKKTGKPGVAIVVPDQCFSMGALSDRLETLFSGDREESAVFVCLTASHAKDRFGEPSDGAALLFLDASGRPVGSVKGDVFDALDRFDEACAKHIGKSSGSARRLPYGVKWDEEQEHKLFGTSYDPCPPCGMPHFDGDSSRMVRYLRLLDR